MTTLHYKILLRKEADGTYTVIVPSLPGCLTFGHAVEEALEMAKEAIEGFVEWMIARGEEVPIETDDAIICTVAVEANDHDMKQKIYDSILLLIEKDPYLLKHDVNERAIAHRLALYLESKFDGWNIDCEYNRDYHDEESITKKLPEHLLNEAERDETKEKTVIPDIIVHHRGPGDNNNLLAIEIKKTSNSTPDRDNFDYLKLMAFKSELKYDYSLFIKFNTGIYFKEGSMDINDNVTIEWDPVAKPNLTSRKAPGMPPGASPKSAVMSTANR